MAAPAGGKQNKCCRNQTKSVGTSHATVGCPSRQHRIQTHGCVNRSHTNAKSNRWNGLMGQPRNGDGTVFPLLAHDFSMALTPAERRRGLRDRAIKAPPDSTFFLTRSPFLSQAVAVAAVHFCRPCLKHRHCQKDGQHNHDNGSRNEANG